MRLRRLTPSGLSVNQLRGAAVRAQRIPESFRGSISYGRGFPRIQESTGQPWLLRLVFDTAALRSQGGAWHVVSGRNVKPYFAPKLPPSLKLRWTGNRTPNVETMAVAGSGFEQNRS
jgi:hypothetical protein